MSLIGNVDTPASYVADYMQACVGMLGIPAGGFTTDIEAFGATNEFNVESLYAAMLNSSIGRSIYAPGSSNATFAAKLVEKLGGSLLSDDAEAWALDWAETQLDNGMSRAALAMAAVEAISEVDTADENFGALSQQFANRIEIANYYTFSSTSPSTTVATLTAILSSVDNETDVSDPAAVLEENTDPGVSTGQTYTLTSGVDQITGTTGADTIIADNSNTTKMLTVADQISGGAGVDTLKIYLQSTDTATNEPAFTDIETLVITGGAMTAYTPRSGVTSLTVDGPVVATQATYTLNGQDLTLKNHTLTASAAATKTTTIAAAATSTATTQNLTVDTITYSGTDKHAIDLSGTKITTLGLTTTGAGSTNGSKFDLTNTGGVLNKITVSGAGDVTVTESLAAVKTIDASAATGKVTFDVSGATMNIAFAFTGGSGNDKLTMVAGNLAATSGLTSGAQLDFGAGTDTLVIKDTTPVYATINAMKNLEVLEIGANSTTVDMAQLTLATVNTGTNAVSAVNNVSSTDVVNITGAATTSVTVGGAVGNSDATINIGTATTAGLTVASLVTTGLTKIAVASSGTNAAVNKFTAMTNTENSAFTITGSNDLTMALTKAATVTGSKVDATAFTGKLDVTATDMVDIIIGGSGADTITGGLLGDTLTGGAGADTFVLTTGAGACLWLDSLAVTNKVDRITDFVAGTDKISITNGTTPTTSNTITSVTVATAADVATLLTAIGTSVAASAGAAIQTGLITVSAGAMAGTYLLINDTTAAAAATDTLINITGVSGTVTSADFILG